MRFGLKRTAAPHVASVPLARDAGRALCWPFAEWQVARQTDVRRNLTAAQCNLGDEVVIKVPEATLLGGTVLIYGLPLMTGTVLSILSSTWGDLWSVAAFATGMLFGFAILWFATVRSGGFYRGCLNLA